jgi:hypothetical protein
VDKLERELRKVLAELEFLLPTYWSNSVKHHLLHLPDFIRRCGPFKTHSMLVFERFHTIFKKLVRNSKLSCMNGSIANHYSKLVNADFWRLRQGGVAPASSAFQSTISGSIHVDWGKSNVKPLSGKRVDRTPSDRDLAQVQDMYADRDDQYSALRSRYRREMKTRHCNRGSRQERKRQRKAYDKAQLPAAWVPADGGRELTPVEQSWLSMTAEVKCIAGARVNVKYMFRTRLSEQTNSTDNSVVKMWRYSRSGNEERNTENYAWILDMFVHELYQGGPSLVILEGNWTDVELPGIPGVRLPVVNKNPESYFNTNGRFVALEDCVPYNLALLPNDLSDRDGTQYSVIDRGFEEELTKRLGLTCVGAGGQRGGEGGGGEGGPRAPVHAKGPARQQG